ncbi:denticleless protein homolog [Uloborus diversus]|uniref:denticleless protein homolog n=1 Tax=Uloborus diversus TaxID=327109 RepID=UPI002409B88F|nr:denticleless protein homolog [Uloborus diversus]
MLLLPYLNHRQTGTKHLSHFSADHYRLKLDNVLSRFVCFENDAITVQSEESEVPPFACRFRRDAASELLAIASEEGDVLLYSTSYDYDSKYLHSFSAHNNAIFDICWLPDKCQMLTASGDYTAALWDMKTCNMIASYGYHCGSVKCVDVCNEQSVLFATGSRDGNISIWDSREHGITSMPLGFYFEKPAISIKGAHSRTRSPISSCKKSSKDTVSSISSVAFQDSRYLASAGAADGIIKMWDLRKTYLFNSKFMPAPAYQINYSESKSAQGCTSLAFDSTFRKLYACSTSGKIFQLDCYNYSDNVIAYEGFNCATYFVKMALSPDDQYLLCGSSDHKAYIWKTSQPGHPILELPGHTEEVTSVAWNPHNILKIATCGDDNKVLVWKVGNEENEEKKAHVLSSCTNYTCDKPLKSSNPKVFFVENSPTNYTEFSQSQKKVKSVELLSKRTPSTPQDLKKPVMKDITSFFSPLSSKPSVLSHVSSRNVFHDIGVENSSKSTHCSKSPSLSHVLSPSKIVNKDNILPNLTPSNNVIVNKTVDENFAGSATELNTHLNDKENCTNQDYSELHGDGSSLSGQTKRKLQPHQTTSKCRKTLLGSSSKTKAHGKKAKKENFPVVKSIKNYFLSI